MARTSSRSKPAVDEQPAATSSPAAPARGLGGEDDYVRVQALDNPGTEFTIRAEHFDDAIYKRLDKPALNNHGEPADPKYPANLPPAVPADEDTAAAPNSGDPAGDGPAQPGETENGHQAENEGVI